MTADGVPDLHIETPKGVALIVQPQQDLLDPTNVLRLHATSRSVYNVFEHRGFVRYLVARPATLCGGVAREGERG